MNPQVSKMPEIILIKNASWIVAWDPQSQCHIYLHDGDIAFKNGVIIYVGKNFIGTPEKEIDGSNLLVIPGLINIHSHPSTEPLRKGITDEIRSPGFFHSSLYEFLTIFNNDPEGFKASAQVAMCELLLSGVTTIVDISTPFENWLNILSASGLRAYAAPSFKDARWYTKNGHELLYEWDTKIGRDGFETAQRIINQANQHPCNRLAGMVCPSQVDTCSPSLLRDSYDYAGEHKLPWQIHAAQSVTEFQEITRRHGKTPIQWMDQIGVLGKQTIIGHAIFLDHHPWLHWTSKEDLGLLSKSQVSVAHCPTVFMRRGISLRTFGSYLKAGVNMGIGTDTYPHNILEEMRNTGTIARNTAENVDDLNTSDVFNAATIGGAKALQRDDIGKITPGAKADLVLVDLKAPSMIPAREPIRSLIFVAGERAVRDVYVDGLQVVADGTVLTINMADSLEMLQEAQLRSMKYIPQLDWAGRSADELSPLVFSIRDNI